MGLVLFLLKQLFLTLSTKVLKPACISDVGSFTAFLLCFYVEKDKINRLFLLICCHLDYSA